MFVLSCLVLSVIVVLWWGGILEPSECTSKYADLEHIVQVVGVGVDEETQEEFYLIRNQWVTTNKHRKTNTKQGGPHSQIVVLTASSLDCSLFLFFFVFVLFSFFFLLLLLLFLLFLFSFSFPVSSLPTGVRLAMLVWRRAATRAEWAIRCSTQRCNTLGHKKRNYQMIRTRGNNTAVRWRSCMISRNTN